MVRLFLCAAMVGWPSGGMVFSRGNRGSFMPRGNPVSMISALRYAFHIYLLSVFLVTPFPFFSTRPSSLLTAGVLDLYEYNGAYFKDGTGFQFFLFGWIP